MNGPAQTPLVDLLRDIPLDARLIYNYPYHAAMQTTHECAAAIERLLGEKK
jgi:hypothetical protein